MKEFLFTLFLKALIVLHSLMLTGRLLDSIAATFPKRLLLCNSEILLDGRHQQVQGQSHVGVGVLILNEIGNI